MEPTPKGISHTWRGVALLVLIYPRLIPLLAAGVVAVLAPCRAFPADPSPRVDPSPAGEAAPAEEPLWVPPDPWATFVYENPAPIYRLRLAAEQLSIQSIAFVGYLWWDPAPSYPGVPPMTAWEKLTLARRWTFDNDSLETNYVGHSGAGTLYWLTARGNRVSVPEAFLWTLGASTFWEIIEFKEPMSINDLLVTPVAGMAVGEAFTQLSGYFDRLGTDGLSQTLAWIFNPVKKFHDWIDKATPVRDPATRGWHEFKLSVSGGVLTQGGPVHGAAQFAFTSRLFRVPGYGEPGGTGHSFADGNVSSIGITTTFAAGQMVDFLFDVETALLGHYARDLRRDGDDLHGWDLFVGGTAAYEIGSHVWNLSEGGTRNKIGCVRFPGLDVRGRIFSGPFRVTAAGDASLGMAGVEPFHAPDSLPNGVYYPTVYVANGYYHALSLHLAALLEITWDSLGAGAAARTDLYSAFTGPFIPSPPGPVTTMDDGRTCASAWVRFRIEDPSLEFSVRGEWRDRWGSVGAQRLSEQERALFGSCALVF